MSEELEIRGNGSPAAVDGQPLDLVAAKRRLAELENPADVATVLAAAKAAALFEKARGARTVADDYTELAIYAEHALASTRRLIPRRPPSRRGGGRMPILDWDKMRKLREQGLSLNQTAKEMGCSRHAVKSAESKGWRRPLEAGTLSPLQEFDSLYIPNWRLLSSLMRLGRIPLPEVEERIRRIRAEGAELTRNRVTYAKPKTAPSGGSPTDKRRRARSAGRIKEPTPDRGTVTLSHVYQSVVQARERYSAIRLTLNAEQREELDGFYSSQDDWARRIANATML